MRAGVESRLAVAARAREPGKLDELFTRFEPLVCALSGRYFYPGTDQDDVRQEARYALLRAVDTFEPDAGAFGPFARLVIDRWLISKLKQARRAKHRILDECVHTITLGDSGERIPLYDNVPGGVEPENELAQAESLRGVLRGVERLSTLERRSLVGLVNGKSYAELSAETGDTEKSIDNAIQRARRKLREAA